jgi:hypothetical protein
MSPALETIVSDFYSAFRKYRAVAPLDVCTECCISRDQERQLLSLPVRQIPFDLLYDYNSAARPEKPGIDEFKHFLPRIIELTAENNFVAMTEELVFSRFSHYSNNEWTSSERQLIQRFAEEYFQTILSTYPLPDSSTIDGILIILYKMKIDLKRILKEWTPAEKNILIFKDLVLHSFKDAKPLRLSNSFSDESLDNILNEWLADREVKSTFAKSIEKRIMHPPEYLDENTQRELSWTYERLNN